MTEYEKDLNELKEQILKEGNTSVTKRDLLERFCEVDKEYNGKSWNLLQILANINILIGEESCEDEIILTKEEYGQLLSNEFDNGYAKGYMEALEQEPVLDKIRAEIVDLGKRTMNDNRASGIWACRDIIDKYKAGSEV